MPRAKGFLGQLTAVYQGTTVLAWNCHHEHRDLVDAQQCAGALHQQARQLLSATTSGVYAGAPRFALEVDGLGNADTNHKLPAIKGAKYIVAAGWVWRLEHGGTLISLKPAKKGRVSTAMTSGHENLLPLLEWPTEVSIRLDGLGQIRGGLTGISPSDQIGGLSGVLEAAVVDAGYAKAPLGTAEKKSNRFDPARAKERPTKGSPDHAASTRKAAGWYVRKRNGLFVVHRPDGSIHDEVRNRPTAWAMLEEDV